MADMLREAIDYAIRGWWVFPCREKPGAPYKNKDGVTIIPAEKTPYTAHGLDDATCDVRQVESWWKAFPNAMIGINAGKSGLFVIDIDKKHVDGLETYTKWNINDSAGLSSLTPSGGMHIVFSGTGKSSTNAKTGIDTRGEGGYFIAPPSKILEGENTGEYKRLNDWGRRPGVIPDGLMSKLFPEGTVEYVRGSSAINQGEKRQLSRTTLNFLAFGAQPGERNNMLFKTLADFAGCGYSKEESKETVQPVANRIGLSNSEFEQVLTHAYSQPRTSSIPNQIQEKIAQEGAKVASKLTPEEQATVELVLLACLLLDNTLIPVVQDILYSEDFQALKNRIIYKAINRLYNAGMRVDIVTVANEVAKETNRISLDDISKLMNQYFVNTDSILTYANIIKEKASFRKIEALMDNKDTYIKSPSLVEAVYKLEKDISDIALYGGAKSTNILTSEQATEMVAEQTRKIVTGEIKQLKIGFPEYDNELGGLYSNELVICAARAGDGKSALALSILNHVSIVKQQPALMFSLEMSTHETICRLICQLTGLAYKDVYTGKLTAKEWDIYKDAMAKISQSPLYFDDTFGISIPELRSKIRKMMEKNIKLIVIDQLEQVSGYSSQAEHIRFDRIAYDIKNLTQEFDVPIILNHQLNRGITDRKLKNPEPRLSDLNQAGEKPANQVWIISHRKDEDQKILQSRIKVLKNRNGAKITFPVVFVGERMLFSSLSPEESERAMQLDMDDNSDVDWANE